MAKKVLGQIKLQVPAGAANPSPRQFIADFEFFSALLARELKVHERPLRLGRRFVPA